MKLFWKIYFWIEAAMTAWFFWHWFHEAIAPSLLFHRVRCLVMLPAFYGLGYQKRIGSLWLWRAVFAVTLALSLRGVYRAGDLSGLSGISVLYFGFEILRYTGLFLYAFCSRGLWKKAE